jgi:tetratricopeptide (TPR) repeat protein
MSFNALGFGTTQSERVSSLHDCSQDSRSAGRSGRHAHGCRRGLSAGSSPAPSTSSLIFAVDGNGLLTRCAATPHGKRTTHSTVDLSGNNVANRVARGSSCSHRSTAALSGEKGMGVGVGVAQRQQSGRPPTPSSSPSLVVKAAHSAGTSAPSLLNSLPPAAAPHSLTLRGTSCAAGTSQAAARPASAGVGGGLGKTSTPHMLRPCSTSAPASRTNPRFNNYVVGQSAATAFRGLSVSKPAGALAASQRLPRVPAATAVTQTSLLPATPFSSTLSRGAFPSEDAASTHSSGGGQNQPRCCSGGAEGNTVVTRDGASGVAGPQGSETSVPLSTSASQDDSQRLSSVYAPAPVRPLLRRLQLHSAAAQHTLHTTATTAAVAAEEEPANASGTASPSAERADGNDNNRSGSRDASTSLKGSSATTRRPPHVPLLQMTRTFALRRPVLLTKDGSVTAAAAAASSSRNTPHARLRESSSSMAERQPDLSSSAAKHPTADVRDRLTASSSFPCSSFALYAAHCSAHAPVPPHASSSQPRRTRRASSLASVASNSSVSLQQQRCSLDEEAGATHLFFAMPSFSVARDSGDNDNVKGRPGDTLTGSVAAAEVDSQAVTARDGDETSASQRQGSISIASLLRGDTAGVQQPSQRRSYRSLPGTTDAGQNSTFVERLRERGNQYMMREEFAQAIAAYSEGIRLAPCCDALWGNRAAAFLLTFRYIPAVADCLYVLNLKPGSVKAYWRAAKAYAAAYRFLDAKKYYLLAQQACMKDSGGGGGGAASAISNGVSCASSVAASERGSRQDKAVKERHAIAAEEAAVETVEQYWQHVRGERWADAVSVMDRILQTTSYVGPTAVSWQVLRLEALLPLQPKEALAEAETLHSTFPDALELYYVLAKALFYTVHDAASTRRCLQLLDEASAKRSAQNTMLNVHVRYAAMQLREKLTADGGGSGGATAAAQLEAWARRNQLKEDSRVAELRHSIIKFARHRDIGNEAYEQGDWDTAAAAYTQCLQTDRLNHALLAAVYCNRTAVYMQSGRWSEALSDADAAIRLSPQLVTAYGRRGRIRLYLLSQEYEAQRAVLSRHFTTQWSATVKEQLLGYADGAAADLTRVVELSPTAEHKSQLQQALAQRQAIKAALSAAPQAGVRRQGGSAASSSSTPCTHTGSSTNSNSNSTSSGFAYQRGYTNSRPSSVSSSSSSYGVLQQHLQLLGLSTPSAAVGILPDLKVVAKAYRECALRWHPDKWVRSTPQEQQEAERQFKLISVAYTTLRERYGDAAKVS